MIRRRITRIVFFTALAFTGQFTRGSAQAVDTPGKISVIPSQVEAGSPELIRVTAPNTQEVSGEWLGKKLLFFQAKDHKFWYALAGVDVEASVGASTLAIDVKLSDSFSHRDLPVEILPAKYRTESISVASSFVEPDSEQRKAIQADNELKARVFSVSAPTPLWHGSFRAPVVSSATDSFGVRRTYNGKLASIHKGMDFRARTGTPVRAGNSGIVVLAKRLYYEGNCVIIDHGLGLYTISMHLSRITVHDGQHVTMGQRLGLSGATGRVTAAHLHWAVRWQGAYLDPAKLLKLNLSGVR